MDKNQVKVLEKMGYSFAGVPGLTGPKKTTYYSRNKITGEMVKHFLPCDPYSLEHYLRKGFVTDKSLLEPQTIEQSGEFVCEVCGKRFTTRIALAGHSRSHK